MEHVVYLDELLSFLEDNNIDTSVLNIVEDEFDPDYINTLNSFSALSIDQYTDKNNQRKTENASFGISVFLFYNLIDFKSLRWMK